MSALSLVGVKHAYFGQTVLDDVSLSIEAGECVALVGPSGAGKSTLLHIAAGLVTPSEGRVERAYGRHAVVFQDPRLLDWKTAAENIAYVLRHRDLNRSGRVERIAEVARLVDLSVEDLTKFPVELSGGMRQRVAIARALAVRPDFVFFDEPFSALDVGLRLRMQDLAVGALLERGAGMMFVTHDLMEAARLAHRLVVLDADGRGLAGERRLEGEPLQRDIALCFARVQDWLVNDPLFAGLNDSDGRRAQ
ncbi:MAG: ABC transporter ATP-binding protein [Alphaproteobacteria bacterium]